MSFKNYGVMTSKAKFQLDSRNILNEGVINAKYVCLPCALSYQGKGAINTEILFAQENIILAMQQYNKGNIKKYVIIPDDSCDNPLICDELILKYTGDL